MFFTESELKSFIDSLKFGIDFIISNILNLFFNITNYPMLAFAIFVPVALILAYMVWEFLLWASDFNVSKNNWWVSTDKMRKNHRMRLKQEERDRISNERFLANYEQRDNYYNAMLANRSLQLKENEKYHNEQLKLGKQRLEEMERYHNAILNKNPTSNKNKYSNYDGSEDDKPLEDVLRERQKKRMKEWKEKQK